jgi:phosphocarrier protein HPr
MYMTQETVIITNESGLHARPATLFTQLAAKFESKITIAKGEKKADAKSILTVLTLGAAKGTEVVLTADGPDEAAAVQQLKEFLTTNQD